MPVGLRPVASTALKKPDVPVDIASVLFAKGRLVVISVAPLFVSVFPLGDLSLRSSAMLCVWKLYF